METMKTLKTTFNLLIVVVLLVATAMAVVSFLPQGEKIVTSEKMTPIQASLALAITNPVFEASTLDTPAINVIVSDDGADRTEEVQYLYMQSENIDSSFAELNEIQQRMYDLAEDIDPVMYDQLQEKIDNARTVAKENRNENDPNNRNSGDGEAEDSVEDEYALVILPEYT